MKIAVIGGGPGGYVAALKAAILGADVTLIEKSDVGGTCLNWGCIPTKALLACSEVIDVVKTASNFGVNIDGDVKFDFEFMNKRKDQLVTELVFGISYLLNKRGVKLVKGFGRLIDKKNIEVSKEDGSKEIIEADKIILATGSVPIIPQIFPYNSKNVITSDEALHMKEVPKSMIIVGGGVIGCEFGQFYRKLGTEITIVEMAKHILPFEDKDVAKQLTEAFERDKMKLLTDNSVESVEVIDDGVVATLKSGETIKSEIMLVSVGRKANIEGLGLKELGVEIERGKVVVNENMETNIEGIYAIGDIVDTPFLAHVASKEGIAAVENALGKDKKMDYNAVPRCIYTDPEVSGVGITEELAKEKGIEYKIGKFPFVGLGKARVIGKIDGFVKVLADKNDTIIGASIVGAHATDLLTELTLAVHLGLTVEQVGDVIHPHPTLSEALMEALHDVHNQCVHSF